MVCDYFLQPDDCLIFKECSFSFLCPASWDSEILTLLVMGGVLKTHSSPFAIAHFFAKKCSAKFLLISLSFLNFPYFVTTQFLKKRKKILSQIHALSTELWPFSPPPNEIITSQWSMTNRVKNVYWDRKQQGHTKCQVKMFLLNIYCRSYF